MGIRMMATTHCGGMHYAWIGSLLTGKYRMIERHGSEFQGVLDDVMRIWTQKMVCSASCELGMVEEDTDSRM